MADVDKSESKSQVKNSTVDPLTAMIPSGDEHHRCREAVRNKGAGVNIQDEDGRMPLMFAVKENHAECVNKLIKAGADVNAVDSRGVPTLMLAIDGNHPKYVDLMIKAGADVNQKT